MEHQDHHPDDRDLIETSFRFVSWLRNHFPEVTENIVPSYYKSFGAFVRDAPTSFWGEVGAHDYEALIVKPTDGDSILEHIIAVVKDASPTVQNEILVGFVEGHMFTRPHSPLAKELGGILGIDFGEF
ncbi:MAG: hypothetical protein ABJO36_09005 [Litorimonas sp.]